LAGLSPANHPISAKGGGDVSRLRLILLVVLMLVVQTAVLSRVRVAGVAPEAMLLLAVCAGIVGGPERGAVVGFVSGIAFDLFLVTTPVGLSALVYALIGYGVGLVAEGTVRSAWWIPVLTAGAASAVGSVMFAVSANVVAGADFVSPRLTVVAPFVGVMNAIVATPVLRLVSWSIGTAERKTALAP
jgi:rod shape-determining protein MreD